MPKLLRKILKICGITLGILVLLLFIAYLLFRSPKVQTYLTNKLAQRISKQLNTRIEVGGVDIALIKTVVLERVYVEDQKGDTLLYARKLSGDLSTWSIYNRKVGFKLVGAEGIQLNLHRNAGQPDFNHQFIVDALSSGKKSDHPVALEMNEIRVQQFRFDFADAESQSRFKLTLSDLKAVVHHLDLPKQKVHFNLLKLQQPSFVFHQDSTTDTLDAAPVARDTSASLPDSLPGNPWDLKVNRLQIDNGHFAFDRVGYPTRDTGIDFRHMNVRDINLLAYRARFHHDTITADLQDLNLKEKSGFQLERLRADVIVNPRQVTCSNLELRTPTTHIRNFVSMQYEGYTAFREFIDEVNIHAAFENSLVNMRDIAFFAPELGKIRKRVTLSGKFKGSIRSFNVNELNIVTPQSGRIQGWVSFNGLPDIEETFMDFQVEEMRMGSHELQSFLPFLNMPDNIHQLGRVHFKGNFTGFYYNFVAHGEFATQLGFARSDIQLDLGEVKSYQGQLAMKDFNLGKFIKAEETFDRVTFNSTLRGSGFKLKNVEARLEAQVKSLGIKGYVYKNIDVDGLFDKRLFKGDVLVDDEYLGLDFNGKIDFNKSLPEFDFVAQLDRVHLQKLNLTKAPYQLQTKARMNFVGDKLDNIEGDIHLEKTTLQRDTQLVKIDEATLTSKILDRHRVLKIQSDYWDGKISGDFNWYELPAAFSKFIDHYLPKTNTTFQLFALNDTTTIEQSHFDFQFVWKKDDGILNVFVPGLSVPYKSEMKGHFSLGKDSLYYYANVPLIQWRDYILYRVNYSGRTAQKEHLKLDFHADALWYKDSLLVDYLDLHTNTVRDTTQMMLGLAPDTNRNHLALRTSLFYHEKGLAFQINQSDMRINDKRWRVMQGAPVHLGTKSVEFANVMFRQKSQSVLINGTLSDDPEDGVDMTFHNIVLKDFATLLDLEHLGIGGALNGDARLENIFKSPHFNTNVHIQQFSWKTDTLGDLHINADNLKDPNNIELLAYISSKNVQTASIEGSYSLQKDISSPVRLQLNLKGWNLKYVQPVAEKFVSDLSGTADASVDISGTLSKPIFQGFVDLQKVGVTIDYLQTHYTFSHRVTLTREAGTDWINLNNITVYDKDSNKAQLDGYVYHDRLQDFVLDFYVNTYDKFFALNTGPDDNEVFHGKAIGSGTVFFQGPIDELEISVSAKTYEGTEIYIPIADEYELQQNEYITFVNPVVDSVQRTEDYEVDAGGVTFNCELEVTPEAIVQIMIGGPDGDVIRSQGNSNLQIEVTPSGEFSMFGNYTIKEGSYSFTFEKVIKKYFTLDKNSTITWNGDPYKAQTDIKATYSVRTSVNNLLSHQPNLDTITSLDLQNRRVPVDCKLLVTGPLASPDINFDIQIPDEYSNAEVQQSLNIIKNDEQELNRQVAGLLMFNSFLPPRNKPLNFGEYSSSATNRSVSDFVSNQLSNWASRAVKGLDVGVHYQTYRSNDPTSTNGGDEESASKQRELQLEVSKRFFNDRVKVNVGGNFYFGDQQQVSNQQSDPVAGDFSVEYSISKDGRLRGRAFRRSVNDLFENKTKTGVGISYNEEFNSLKELWHNIIGKKSKEKKNKKKQEQQEEQKEQGAEEGKEDKADSSKEEGTEKEKKDGKAKEEEETETEEEQKDE